MSKDELLIDDKSMQIVATDASEIDFVTIIASLEVFKMNLKYYLIVSFFQNEKTSNALRAKWSIQKENFRHWLKIQLILQENDIIGQSIAKIWISCL